MGGRSKCRKVETGPHYAMLCNDMQASISVCCAAAQSRLILPEMEIRDNAKITTDALVDALIITRPIYS